MGSKIHLKRISLNGVSYHRTPKVRKLRTEKSQKCMHTCKTTENTANAKQEVSH